MRCPPMRKTESNEYEEDMPEHIQKLREKNGLDEGGKSEIDWEFWHFIAVYLFRFSEEEFFNKTTLRRLFSLTDQYQKFHSKDG